MSVLDELRTEIKTFAEARNWTRFHTPKNLAMAIAGEAGELSAAFQWLTPEESGSAGLSEQQLGEVEFEMADIAIYLLRLSDVLDIDLEMAIRDKLTVNGGRFPISSS